MFQLAKCKGSFQGRMKLMMMMNAIDEGAVSLPSSTFPGRSGRDEKMETCIIKARLDADDAA